MWPSLFILGGGVSKNADKFIPRLTTRTPVVAGPAAQRRRDHRRGDRGRRGARATPGRDLGRPAARASARPPSPIQTAHAVTDGRPSDWYRGVCIEGPSLRPSDGIDVSRSQRRPPNPRAPAARDLTTETRRPTHPAWSSAASPSMPPTARRSRSSTRRRARPSRRRRSAGAPMSIAAVDAAQAAFEERKGWANWAAGKRGRTLAKLADLIKKNSEELAWLESRNGGKPITSARGEVIGASLVFDYYAGAANKIYGQTIPVSKPGHRPDPARADRRRRADRAVELPAADGRLEGGSRRSPPATPRSSSRRRTRR